MSNILALVHTHVYMGYGLIFLWLNQTGGAPAAAHKDIIPQWRWRRR